MKVLFLATDAYGGHGGIAYYNRCLAEAVAEMPEVTEVVVVPRVSRFAHSAIPQKIRFVATAMGGKGRYIKAVAALAWERFDIVICGHINLLPLATTLTVLQRVPLVLQVHGIDAWSPHGNLLVRKCLRRVSAVWSVSAVTRDRMNDWAKLPLERYAIIPNTVDLERYGMAPRRADLVARHGLAGNKVILTLARLAGYERYKGIDEVILALPNLLLHEPTLKYLVVGDGDDQPRLQAKAAALGVDANVIFTGYVDEAQKADYLRLADAFVLPGRGEGFGIVYLEAMACGVPVVGSLLDGSSEALRGGQLGELADPNDQKSVCSAVLRALNKIKVIPPGLSYFSWPAFANRVATAVRLVHVATEK